MLDCCSMEHIKLILHASDAVRGWAGWVLDHPEFGVLVNPISTRGAYYAQITTCPPRFENLTTSLHTNISVSRSAHSAEKPSLGFLILGTDSNILFLFSLLNLQIEGGGG